MVDDTWASGDEYEPYVGRWSRRVADEFVGWLDVRPDADWLDVGCGTGALSEAIADTAEPAHILGIDPSAGFVAYAERRLRGRPASFHVGDAQELPAPDDSRDAVVAGLVLNFVPNPARGVAEMARVARPRGTVGAYVWDYAGGMELMRYFWDVAASLDAEGARLHEKVRFGDEWTREHLARLFEGAGLSAVRTTEFVVETPFTDFDDYWTPFLGGQGAAPSYLRAADAETAERIREALRTELPFRPDGSLALTARAWAVKGRA